MNPKIDDWRGKRVWLVGASSGIGAALAQALLQRGAQVAVSARRAEALQALAAGHRAARVLAFDFTDRAAFARAQDELCADWGGIDLVVFSAGAYAPMRAWELDCDRIDQLIDINLRAPMAAAAHLIPLLMKQGGGALAFIASVAGYRGLPKAAAYGPTKAALINFAETLYLDLAPRGISVYLINPGFVATPMTAANDFDMPALISSQQAAEEIILGFARGSFEIHFPRRFTRWLKLLRLLPYSLYFALVRRFTKA
ncbi:MAG: SDR family NAD(P)-dependent oxidoreductase [Proteobacteria bacterium]|jgi:NAD(P)-dependent dehydrogenase (short-subunit alcohol dehydrogenase family)|nr:SDR family NAD(P)-dependent oxidoreductase [Pseudomonadota bacterium]